ncbi:MAG: hypothetical protein WBC73_02555 [Phormidesmis sp.]
MQLILHSVSGGDDDGDSGVGDVSTGTTLPFKRRCLGSDCLSDRSGGLLVILASVRQQGLYPPVEAVPPKPSSLLLKLIIACPKDSPSTSPKNYLEDSS